MRRHLLRAALIGAIAATSGACATLKGYQKVYINDPDMVLADKDCVGFETTFHAYREAAVGGTGGTTGGGCGCN